MACSGTLGATPISNGKLRADEITFTAGTVTYTGHVNASSMQGTYTSGKTGQWTAKR